MIRLLPCHPQRRDGEILSTWMLRVASANVNSVRELCKWLGSDAVLALDLMGYNNPLVGPLPKQLGLRRRSLLKAFLPAFTGCTENPLHMCYRDGLPLGGYWEVLRHRNLVTSIAPPVSGSSGTISFGGPLLSILAA
jgi:hypothetical protein